MRFGTGRLLAPLALALIAAPLTAAAQGPPKVYRIGFLTGSGAPTTPPLVEAFRQGLHDLGYVEGRNIVIENRWADGRYERLPELAAELVRDRVDIILAVATPAVRAAKSATQTIPIVMAAVVDPLQSGLVASLGRPGGNITGVTLFAGPEIAGKQLELLREAVPKLSRVAVLWNPANPSNA